MRNPSEPDSHMIWMLQLSNRKFKIIMNSISKEKVDIIEEQMDHVSRDMGFLRKNPKRVLGEKPHSDNEDCF